MDIEDKLALIQELRRQQQYRERYAHERNYKYYGTKEEVEEEIPTSSFSSLRLRIVIALFLFVLVFFMDVNDFKIGEIDYTYIQDQISQNADLDIFIMTELVKTIK